VPQWLAPRKRIKLKSGANFSIDAMEFRYIFILNEMRVQFFI